MPEEPQPNGQSPEQPKSAPPPVIAMPPPAPLQPAPPPPPAPLPASAPASAESSGPAPAAANGPATTQAAVVLAAEPAVAESGASNGGAPAVPSAPVWRRAPQPEPRVEVPAERRYQPIIIPDDEPEHFEHGHGHPVLLVIRRALAFALDTLGMGFVFLVFLYRIAQAGVIPLAQTDRALVELAAFAFFSALAFLFFCEAVFGTSLGKLLMGLHVRTIEGGRAHAHQHLVRNVFRILDVLLIGLVLIFILRRHRQRLGDLASGTTVGRSPLGVFGPVLGIVVFGALGWYTFTGGNLDTVKTLAAKAENAAPGLEGRTKVILQAQPFKNVLRPGASASAAPAASTPAPAPTK